MATFVKVGLFYYNLDLATTVHVTGSAPNFKIRLSIQTSSGSYVDLAPVYATAAEAQAALEALLAQSGAQCPATVITP